jgi:hypothetical protein
VIFFGLALVGMEYLRCRELGRALTAAWVAMRAAALGILVELAGALSATTLWVVAVAFGA